MIARKISIVVAALSMLLAGVASAQTGDDQWIILDAREIGIPVEDVVIDLRQAKGQFKAIRITATSGRFDVANLRINYGDGSHHNEVRQINLRAGERTRSIGTADVRDRFIDEVVIKQAVIAAARAKATIEIWGLQSAKGAMAMRVPVRSPAVDAEAKPSPPPRAAAPITAPRPSPPVVAAPAPAPPVAAAEAATPPVAAPAPAPRTRAFGQKSGSRAPDAAAKDGAIGAPVTSTPDSAAYKAISVFFGTNRQEAAGKPVLSFSAERDTRVQLGRAVVTVPKSHLVEVGIERPSWWDVLSLRNPYKEDPARHFTIQEIQKMDEAQFFALAKGQLAWAKAYKGHAFVFVHGYLVTFDNALYRTAQIAHDLDFDGVPYLYSWPTGGGILSYGGDRDSAELATQHFLSFLDKVLEKSGAENVHVIAHSMGNEPLIRALQAYVQRGRTPPALAQIVFAAPDMDRDKFEQMAAQLSRVGRGRTLYASGNDVALSAARRALGVGAPRAGEVLPPPRGPVIVPGIDTIDVSSVSKDYFSFNHSQYAEKTKLIDDMKSVLMSGRAPSERTPSLQRQGSEQAAYWLYPQ